MALVNKCILNSLGARPVLGKVSIILMIVSLTFLLVVDFQNSRINPEETNGLEGNLYISEGKHFVGVTTSKMLYTNPLLNDEYYNSFLLMHNRTTNEIELMQIDQVTVCPVTQKENQINVLSKNESSLSELNKQFGSKRTKRLTEQRERLTMNIEAVKDQLIKTVSGK